VTISNNVNTLTPEVITQWMDQEKNFYLVHVLPNDHFQKVHLPGSDNACVFEVTFLNQIKNIIEDKGAEIVLYGSSSRSMDAVQAAIKLEHEGYRNVSVMEGGLEVWRSLNLPLDGDAIDETGDPQTFVKLENRPYSIDPESSDIVWTGRNPHTTHFGTVQIAGGELQVQDNFITGIFDIDMHSMTNTNLEGDELQPVLVGHLKSDDFFLVDHFPSATFQIYSGRPVKEPYITSPNFEIQGALELHGVEAEQSFMATVAGASDGGISCEAHFDLDRTRWNIIYGSTRFFEHLGMHVVFDLISIQMRIIAR